jgi:viroplasmin and RNaseH domain-containing protein
MKYYAVKCGVKPGIYTNWPDCKAQVDGFRGAVFKSFLVEAEAEAFMKKKARKRANPTVFTCDTIQETKPKELSKSVQWKIDKCLDAICSVKVGKSFEDYDEFV